MVYIPIAEAVKRLGKSDRQVRRMVHSGKLTYRYAPDKRLEILSSDVDKWVRHALPTQELERLDRVEQEIIQLRERLDTLSSRVDTFITPQEKSPQKTTTRPITAVLEPGEALPDGWVLVDTLVKQHNLDKDARKRAIRYLDKKGLIHRGNWRSGGHPANLALDQEGIQEFKRRYVDTA